MPYSKSSEQPQSSSSAQTTAVDTQASSLYDETNMTKKKPDMLQSAIDMIVDRIERLETKSICPPPAAPVLGHTDWTVPPAEMNPDFFAQATRNLPLPRIPTPPLPTPMYKAPKVSKMSKKKAKKANSSGPGIGTIPVPLPPVFQPPPTMGIPPDFYASAVNDDLSSDESVRSVPPKSRTGHARKKPSPSNYFDDYHGITAVGHSDLFAIRSWKHAEDQIYHLLPWKRNVYVTYHEATSVDFEQYLWLFQAAQPDVWYFWIDQEAHQLFMTMQNDDVSDAARLQFRRTVMDTMPGVIQANAGALACPRINATRALVHDSLSSTDDSASPLQSGTHCRHGSMCGCFEFNGVGAVLVPRHQPAAPLRPSQLTEHRRLKYYSIVQSFHTRKYDDDRYYPSPSRGHGNRDMPGASMEPSTPIYKLVVHGTREAAASAAFYNAGNHGWSTVFTCAVPDNTAPGREFYFGEHADGEGGASFVRHEKELEMMFECDDGTPVLF